jgi:arylformamidase
MNIYPGDPRVNISRVKTFLKDGLLVSKISMGLHTGTHIDAPLHYLPHGKTIDKISPERLTGKAIVCDLSSLKGDITGKDLQKFQIEQEDIVFLNKNRSLDRGSRSKKEQVYLALPGAEYLIKKKIKAVGIDCLSIENPDSADAQVHKKLLEKGIPIIEGLVLAHVRGIRYLTHCSPLNIKGAEASPARCILVETEKNKNRIL